MSEIVRLIKPWGWEEILESNDNYLFKKLFMRQGEECSLQYHNKKIETIYILSGQLYVMLDSNNAEVLKSNDILTIKSTVVHQMKAITDCVYLEASSPYPKDVVRLKDKYGRV